MKKTPNTKFWSAKCWLYHELQWTFLNSCTIQIEKEQRYLRHEALMSKKASTTGLKRILFDFFVCNKRLVCNQLWRWCRQRNTKAKSENTNRNYRSVCHLYISDNISHGNEAMHEKAGKKQQSWNNNKHWDNKCYIQLSSSTRADHLKWLFKKIWCNGREWVHCPGHEILMWWWPRHCKSIFCAWFNMQNTSDRSNKARTYETCVLYLREGHYKLLIK